MASQKKRVLLVGCGAAGIACLAAFEQARSDGSTGVPEVVCYEKQSRASGLWNYHWSSVNEHNEPTHSPMYHNLWTNNPKEAFYFAQYTMEEHFGKVLPSYLNRAAVQDYLDGICCKFDLYKYVKFNHSVRQVVKHDNRYMVFVEDRDGKTSFSELYDHVIVAAGHFSTPNYPTIEGIENFTGRTMHAREFRHAKQFINKKVLIIGGNLSAEDIALQCYKYCIKDVIVSYRSRPVPFPLPEAIKQVPKCVGIDDDDTCRFENGETFTPDVIVFGTGYQHHYPFMAEEVRLRANNSFYPPGLYKGVLLQRDTNIAYMGAQDQALSMYMFDAQAYFVRDHIMQRIQIDDEAERQRDIDKWLAKLEDIKCPEDTVTYQTEYVMDLKQHCSWPRTDQKLVEEYMLKTVADKFENLLTYRDKSFGGSPKPKVPWLRKYDHYDALATCLQE